MFDRRLLIKIAACVLCIGIAFFALPKFLSTSSALEKITYELGKKYGGSWEADNAIFKWWGPQKLQGIHYINDDRSLNFDIDYLEAQIPFSALLTRNLAAGKITFKGINAQINNIIADADPIIFKQTHLIAEKDGFTGLWHIDAKGIISHGKLESRFAVETDNLVFDEKKLFSSKKNLLYLLFKNLQHGTNFSVNMDNSLFESHVNGQIKDGFLIFTSPLNAHIKDIHSFISSFLSKRLLSLNKFINAEASCSLTIDPQDFSFQLSQFSFNSLNINLATLQFDELYFDKSLLQRLFFVNFIKKEQFPDERTQIRTTPLLFSVKDGKINIPRFDFLFMEAFPLAVWGDIDLSHQYVDLVLGVTPKILQFFFENAQIQTTTMLQIPFQGPFHHAKIDKKKMAARIKSLLSQESNALENIVYSAFLNFSIDENKQQQQPSDPPPLIYSLPWNTKMDP